MACVGLEVNRDSQGVAATALSLTQHVLIPVVS